MKKEGQATKTPGFHELKKNFFGAIEKGDALTAERVIEQGLEEGWSVHSIYLHLLTPTQVEIGERWSRQEMNVAQGHLATHIILRQMERLRTLMRSSERLHRRIVVSAVSGEQHVVGARMIADFLGADGWDVDFLGANTPSQDLLEFLEQRKPDVLAISVTIEEHLPSALKLVQTIRDSSAHQPRVLFGGRAFSGNAGIAYEMGGDGFAGDALEALREARRLVGLEDETYSLELFLKNLGKRIQRLRKQAGWSQQKLAELAGLDRTYISGVEHGKQNVTLGAVSKIADALNLSLHEILKNENSSVKLSF